MRLRSDLPEPVYVAVVTAMARTIGLSVATCAHMPAQAAFAAWCFGDVRVGAAAGLAAAAGLLRAVALLRWRRVRDEVVDAEAAFRWERVLLHTSLPFSVALGLVAAATMAGGDATWSLVECVLGVAYMAGLVGSIGMRASHARLHLVGALAPILLVCLWRWDAPHGLLAAMMVIYIVVTQKNARVLYDAMVDRVCLQYDAHLGARRDALTGLGNRLALDEALRALEERGAPYALLVLDLDGFKQVNDTHGHGAGDELLKRIASRLQGALRKGEMAGRLGGDEFAVLAAPGRAAALAAALVEICRLPVPHGAGALRVGASVGVAFGPDAQLRQRADEALYAAKRAGKDCWRASRTVPLAA